MQPPKRSNPRVDFALSTQHPLYRPPGGVRPQGWMSPGWSETFHTPDLLREAGIEYVCQWVVDDLPTWLETKHGRLVALPYGLDINDSVIYAIEKHSSPEMKLRIEQAVRTFEREIREQGRPSI